VLENCSCANCCPQPFCIYTGEDKTIALLVKYQNGAPFDLTECSEISIGLPNADGTRTTLLLSLGQVVIVSPTNLGNFTALITNQVSSLLNVGELQNIYVSFTVDGVITAVIYNQALNVFEF
jgi:hypothetical protein